MRERWWCSKCGAWTKSNGVCCEAETQRLTGTALWEVEALENLLGRQVNQDTAGQLMAAFCKSADRTTDRSKIRYHGLKLLSGMELSMTGVLQEVNRQVLHPLGLSMEIDLASSEIVIFDNREDPEGFLYETLSTEMTQWVEEQRKAKVAVRVATGGCDDRGVQIRDIHRKPRD